MDDDDNILSQEDEDFFTIGLGDKWSEEARQASIAARQAKAAVNAELRAMAEKLGFTKHAGGRNGAGVLTHGTSSAHRVFYTGAGHWGHYRGTITPKLIKSGRTAAELTKHLSSFKIKATDGGRIADGRGIQLYDHYQLTDADISRTSKDGYLVATPRVARTGIQLYLGDELGRKDMKVVRVWRPEEEVFKVEALHSFAHRPVTDDHPPVNVTSENWQDYARGQAGGEVLRDGEFVRVPLAIMDSRLIKKFDAGKREISVGYSADIEWTSGKNPDGEAYDAIMRNYSSNHFAVVDQARGGSKLRFGDSASGEGAKVNMQSFGVAVKAALQKEVNKGAALGDSADLFLGDGDAQTYPLGKGGVIYLDALRSAQADAIVKGDHDIAHAVATIIDCIADNSTKTVIKPQENKMTDAPTTKTVVIDSISVQMSDVAEQVVQRELAKLQTQVATDTAKHATEIAAKDAEIATLKKNVEDGALTPAKLDALVKDRETVVVKAKTMHNAVVVDGKTLPEIKRQVVDAKMGETAKGWTDEQIAVSFDTLSAGVKVPDGVSQLAQTFSQPQLGDKQADLTKRAKRLEDAWKTPSAGQA